jgi:hypothetical protein
MSVPQQSLQDLELLWRKSRVFFQLFLGADRILSVGWIGSGAKNKEKKKKKKVVEYVTLFLFHLEAFEEGRSVNRFVAFCSFVRCFVFPPPLRFCSRLCFPEQQHLFPIYPRFLFVLLGSRLSKVPDPLLIWNWRHLSTTTRDLVEQQ